MSDDPMDSNLDIREQIVRIDRNIAETQKLLAEARKFDRDRGVASIVAVSAITGVLITAAQIVLRARGVLP